MQKVATTSVSMTDEFFKPVLKDIEHYARKLFEDDPNRPFTIRMSSIGKPLCILQMEKAKAPRVEDEWNHPLRMFFGGVIEATTVAILKHAGINVEQEQFPCVLDIAGIKITGTGDLVIDGAVWDVKSASQFTFKEKFDSYETLKADDTFGYIPQICGYAKAKGLKPGGWFVIDKSSGIIKVIPFPDNYEPEMEYGLDIISRNASVLLTNEPFKRKFLAVDEKFQKRFTGNKTLGIACTYCPFKYTCWPGLQHLPSQSSTAFNRPYKYYTELHSENKLG